MAVCLQSFLHSLQLPGLQGLLFPYLIPCWCFIFTKNKTILIVHKREFIYKNTVTQLPEINDLAHAQQKPKAARCRGFSQDITKPTKPHEWFHNFLLLLFSTCWQNFFIIIIIIVCTTTAKEKKRRKKEKTQHITGFIIHNSVYFIRAQN